MEEYLVFGYYLSYFFYREFVQVVVTFPKPIIAAVNGAAIGLGVAILPLCDIIYASDKASFSCPYSRLAQTPEGCASHTFPSVMGLAMVRSIKEEIITVKLVLAGHSFPRPPSHPETNI